MLQESKNCDWFKEKAICITGGGGFLGLRLAQEILNYNPKKVVAFGRKPISQNNSLLKHKNYEYIVGNVLDPKALKSALKDCSVVYHLAALKNAHSSKLEPLKHFETNTYGTANVLEICRSLDIINFIYVSTGHVYGCPNYLPVDEKHETNPLSIYAASKLSGENIVAGYSTSYGLSCNIVRLANMYGELNTETIIGRAIKQAINGGPIHLFNLQTIRDFIHVYDVVEALLRIATVRNKHNDCRIVNVSSGKGTSAEKIANMLSQICIENNYGKISIQGDDRYERIKEFYLDNTYLIKLTGWQPQINLSKGLRLFF